MKFYIDFNPMSKNRLSDVKLKFPEEFPPSAVDRTYFKQSATVVKTASLNHALYDLVPESVSDFELRSRQKGYTREQASQDIYQIAISASALNSSSPAENSSSSPTSVSDSDASSSSSSSENSDSSAQ